MNEERELTVGQYLRRERERKSISLESISQATRITLENLEALEKDDFQFFSAPLFVRGFLKSYAAQMGLDPADIISKYETQIEAQGIPQKLPHKPSVKEISPWTKYLLTLLIVALGVAIIFSFFLKKTASPPQSLNSAAVQDAPQGAPAKVPLESPPPLEPGVMAKDDLSKSTGVEKGSPANPASPESGISSKALLEEKKEKRHVLRVQAMEKTWLSIQSDDQPEVEALLQPNETATWTARRQFKITVGNAGGIDLSFNGVHQGPLGESGQVVHLIFPKEIKPPDPEKETD